MIQTITARLNHPQAPDTYKDCYCFDNPEMDLVAEPFVESATKCIKKAMEWSSIPVAEKVQLTFIADDVELAMATFKKEQHPVLDLSLRRPDKDGHLYEVILDWPDGKPLDDWAADTIVNGGIMAWFCPVLTMYFPKGTPEKIYVQVKPL